MAVHLTAVAAAASLRTYPTPIEVFLRPVLPWGYGRLTGLNCVDLVDTLLVRQRLLSARSDHRVQRPDEFTEDHCRHPCIWREVSLIP